MRNSCGIRASFAVAAGLALAAGGVAGSAGAARALVATPAATAATPAAAVAGGTISTVAGGVGGPGPARSVAMVNACGLRAAGASLYIGTGAGNIGYGSALRRVNVVTGALTTVAGNGADGPVGDGGAATATAVGPCSSTVDPAGNLVIPDGLTVRLVAVRTGTFYGQKMTAGTLYDVAVRGGQEDINGDAPLAFDRGGNLVVADAEDGPNFNGVWLVAAAAGTFYGQKMAAGDTYSIAGGDGPGFSGDRGPARGAELNGPDGVTVDRHGNVIIVDQGNNRVRVVAAASGSFYGIAMHAGDIYTVAGDGASGYGGDGGRARTTGVQPVAVAVDAAGNLIVSDDSQRVRVVAASTGTFYGQKMTVGDIYTIAGNGTAGFSGSGGPATKAEFSQVGGVAVDGHGNVIVTDTRNDVVWAIAARAGRFYGRAMTAGDSYVVAGGGTRILGDGGPATAAKLDPVNVAVSAGRLLVTDNADSRIRAIAP